MGVSLAASLTALVGTTPVLQAAINPAREAELPPISAPRLPVLAQAAADPPVTPYQGRPPPGYDGVLGAIQDWLARANREYQGVVIRRLSEPADGAGSDEIAGKIQETKAEAARAGAAAQAEEAAKKASEAKEREAADKAAADRKSAEAKTHAAADEKKAAEERAAGQKAEADRKAASSAKSEADQKAADEAARKATADATAKAEAQRLANEREIEAQRAADERRKAEAEARRIEDERRQADARRVADEQRQMEAHVADERRKPAEAPLSEAGAQEGRRTIVLTTEPIGRRDARDRSARKWRSAAYDEDRAPGFRYVRGPRVERWVRHDSRRFSCRRAGRRITPPGRYTVAVGDSLWRISELHYRSGRFYRKIYRANRRLLRHSRRIHPCQRIYVPRLWR